MLILTELSNLARSKYKETAENFGSYGQGTTTSLFGMEATGEPEMRNTEILNSDRLVKR
jgi:hypothetical protein